MSVDQGRGTEKNRTNIRETESRANIRETESLSILRSNIRKHITCVTYLVKRIHISIHRLLTLVIPIHMHYAASRTPEIDMGSSQHLPCSRFPQTPGQRYR